MSVIGIQSGQVEPVIVLAIDENSQFVTGKTDLKLRVRRCSDGFFLDWFDNTFKIPSSVSQMWIVMTEFSSTYSPGEYILNTPPHTNGFDTSLITNPIPRDVYFVLVVQDGSGAANFPQYAELRVGSFVTSDNSPVMF
jgi:hypothetical protein